MADSRNQYLTQKANAKKRGIAWEFTYATWLEWWGDDLSKRGIGHDQLCMQRFGDTGPYSPDNVKKGYPRDNAKTAGVIKRHKRFARCVETKQTQDDWAVIHRTFFGGEEHGSV